MRNMRKLLISLGILIALASCSDSVVDELHIDTDETLEEVQATKTTEDNPDLPPGEDD